MHQADQKFPIRTHRVKQSCLAVVSILLMRPKVAFWLMCALIGVIFGTGCAGDKSVANIKPTTHGKWTILVFLNAANDLDPYSVPNVLQMQKVATNKDVRFVVQWKQSTSVSSFSTFNGTKRFLITPSASNNVDSKLIEDMGTGVDMGIPQTLNDFIAWGKSNFPADHYAVVVWDHGNGWLPKYKGGTVPALPPAVSYDDETGHSIQIYELNRGFTNQHVDIIAFDASLMQMSEVAYQLRNNADYIAASEESPPGLGYPYQRVFAPFTNTPDASPRVLSKAFVDGMIDEPSYSTQKITQSVIDTSKLPQVASAAAVLSSTLVANSAALSGVVAQVRTETQSYSKTNSRYFFDSIDLCNHLSSLVPVQAVKDACSGYATAVTNAVIWEGHNSLSPGSHGMAIDFSPSSSFSGVSTYYTQLDWNSASHWSDWLTIAPS